MFLYLFDMLDFDENGRVCQSKSADLYHARSNFLYLLSKYNQHIAQEMNVQISPFFKEELNDVLFDVENKGNFEKATKLVLANCFPEVLKVAKGAKTQRELIERLNERVSGKDMQFANKFKEAGNDLHLQYIITNISGSVFDNIDKFKQKDLSDKKNKSALYKEMIKYNSLIHTSNKLAAKEISVANFKTASSF